jgi:PEP-CTERM motif
MRIGFLKALAISGVLSAAGALPAHAALIDTFEGNDCSGLFGQKFEECRVPEDLSGVKGGTPVIIKFEFNDDGDVTATFINSALFPSIDGSEFSFDFGDDGNTGTGSWTYVQGVGDPEISVFAAKGGNIGFNLYSTDGDYSDVEFVTPNNPNGSPAGLSHLTFYDTDGDIDATEPGTLALLGLGLFAIGMSRRRRL